MYSAIGGEVAAQQHDVLAGRAVVPKATKLARVVAAFARTAAEAPVRALRRPARVPTRILELSDVSRL